MELLIEWGPILKLKNASKENLIYSVDLKKVPISAGIYIFGRKWGSNFEALYVGQASNGIKGRVKNQFNNLRLMQHLRNSSSGEKVLLAAVLKTKPGQQASKCLNLIERGFIRYFLSEGHDLVNKSGTRLNRHEITAKGRKPRINVPRTIYVEQGKSA